MTGWLKRLWARVATPAAAALLAGCAAGQATETPAQKPAGPAMWALSDRDTTIYLFGTIHLLPPGQAWRTPAMEQALASADELVTEVVLDGNEMAAAQAMQRMGFSPGLPPLAERVPAGKREQLLAMAKESGVPLPLLDRMETWAAALALTGVTFKQLGLDPALGVENQLRTAPGAKGKPTRGLETVEDQFGLFDTLPEQAQRDFLLGVLDQPAEAKAEFMKMLSAWASGDVEAIAKTFNDELFSPMLRQRLLGDRNRRWADWLAKRLEQPGTVFVAVGAGHLAGEDSVQNMLAAKGLKTRRVQ
jgi:uncharacterized protein YbaP (TraB family)